jgi:hypothetical protein
LSIACQNGQSDKVHSMKWITAFHLQEWARRTTAKAQFPELVADLIRATATDIGAFRFPSGEKGYIRGFDGVLQTTAGAGPFVPKSESFWEFGLDADVAAKADLDYKKRTGEVAPEIRKRSTLVLATAYTWDKPKLKLDTWLKNKHDLGDWGNVLLIDGLQLEHWLDERAGVAAWWARKILKLVPELGVRSTDEFWDEYSHRFDPPLNELAVLAARQEQAKSLVTSLMDGESKLRWMADSPDEVVAFAVAAIRIADPQKRLFLESRALIVDTNEAAGQLIGQEGLIFLPVAGARARGAQLSNSGPTLITAGANEDRKKFAQLERPSTLVLAQAMAPMFSGDLALAMKRARECGRSLAVLARLIAGNEKAEPKWLSQARDLIPAFLAGGWDSDNTLDTSVLQALGRRDEYDAVEEPLREFIASTDPPIDRVESIWRMRAPVDAFTWLWKRLGPADFKALATAANKVFGQVIEPPKAADRFRFDAERVETYSPWLREGLATTLLLIAALGEEVGLTIPKSTPKRFINDIVSGLPGLSTDPRVMASLGENLTYLAEAAPESFLGALEQLLEGGPKTIGPLFAELDDFFAPTSPHVYVLFALEVLAWDPAYLPRVTKILAGLASADPGVKGGNSPINTLRSIFIAWAPATNATARQRRATLASVIQDFPGIAWSLLVQLLPKHHDHVSSNPRPRFREAGGSEVEEVTYGIVWGAQNDVVQLALGQVGTEPARMITLINEVNQVPQDSFNAIYHVTAQFLEAARDPDRYEVWNALRRETNRNRTYQEMDWSLKGEPIAKLEALVSKFEPKDPLQFHSNLFDDWMPHLPDVADDDTDAVDKARAEAVLAVLAFGGVGAVIALAQRVKVPYLIVPALEKANLSEADSASLVSAALGAGTPDLIAMASSVSAWRFAKGKKAAKEWGEELIDLAGENDWPAETFAMLLIQWPDGPESWAMVEKFGEEVNKSYWSVKHPFAIKGSKDDLAFAFGRYLAEGRALAAMSAAHSRLGEVDASLLFRALDEAVDQINAAPPANGTMTSYYVEAVFKSLTGREGVSDEEIAKREYAYLSLFELRKEPLRLHYLIVQRPELFMDIIKLVFKPASGESPPPDEKTRRKATSAYRLLGGINVVPGQAGNDVDEKAVVEWCLAVQKMAAEVDRVRITEQYIGHVLAHSPLDPTDNGWPHRAVRAAIERLDSDDVAMGINTERHNMRGAFWKAMGEGGVQERDYAKQAREWSEIAVDYPRTASMLRDLADGWERSAQGEDIRAAKQSLRD